jgi:hypothetical protein
MNVLENKLEEINDIHIKIKELMLELVMDDYGKDIINKYLNLINDFYFDLNDIKINIEKKIINKELIKQELYEECKKNLKEEKIMNDVVNILKPYLLSLLIMKMENNNIYEKNE